MVVTWWGEGLAELLGKNVFKESYKENFKLGMFYLFLKSELSKMKH